MRFGCLIGDEGHAPHEVIPVIQHDGFEGVLGIGERALSEEDVLLKSGGLGLGLHDVDGREKALFDLAAIAGVLLFGEADGFDLDGEVAVGVGELPVILNGLRDGFDDALTELCVGEPDVATGDFDAIAVVIEKQAPPERLGDVEV